MSTDMRFRPRRAEVPRPVFRRMRRGDTVGAERLTGQSVALIVKRRANAAGLGPEQLSGHSLRAGYVTAAAAAGVEERKIANVSRHKDLPVLRRYIRAATAFDDVGEVL
jgi:integrase